MASILYEVPGRSTLSPSPPPPQTHPPPWLLLVLRQQVMHVAPGFDELHLVHDLIRIQCRKKALLGSLAVNCSEMCLNCSWMAVVPLPIKAANVVGP